MTGEPYVVLRRTGSAGRATGSRRRGGSGRKGCHCSPPRRRGVGWSTAGTLAGVRLRPGGQPRVRAPPSAVVDAAAVRVGRGVTGIARDRERSTGPDGAGHGLVGRRGLLRRTDRQGVRRGGDGCCPAAPATSTWSVARSNRVVDYTRTDFTRTEERYDVILDNVEAQPLAAVRRALTPAGTLIPEHGRGGRWLGPISRIVKRACCPGLPVSS